MKHLIVILTVLASMSYHLRAQNCTPLTDLPDSVLVYPLPYLEGVPGTGIMDTACVGSPYSTTVFVNVPSQIESPFGTLSVNSIEVATDGALQGIPASLDYVCNPPNCIFPANSDGCINLYGTPQPGEEGTYDAKISVVVKTTLFDLPFTLPDGTLVQGNYFVTVKPAADCMPASTTTFSKSTPSVITRPNPFRGQTEFVITTAYGGNYRMTITDLTGRPVDTENISVSAGENVIPFDAGDLTPGYYEVTFNNGREIALGTMVILGR